ncbi:MAG: hypothetical protein M0P95_12885 [Sulfuritalea sp.]|jgi:hypothetical protein|nr:hypothetical protein [Sulfuritalea sp.]
MSSFKVEIFFESEGAVKSDPALTTEVIADDEIHALSLARSTLKDSHPEMNFMKVWCWNIQKLDYVADLPG